MRQVFFNFQGNAVVGVLAFLGVALAEVAAVGTALFLVITGRASAARRVLLLALAAAAVYFGVLLAFSASSREQVADWGDEKYFCEVDCHLAYSVAAVSRVETLVTGSERVTSRGSFRVVTLRVRFDEDTISTRRPQNLTLTPNSRFLRVVDAAGRTYPPDPAGQRALEAAEGAQIPLTRALLPGESYQTRVVFDLPEGVPEPLLLLTETSWLTRFLIGHENSLFHRKTSFRLVSSRPERLSQLSGSEHQFRNLGTHYRNLNRSEI